MAERDVKPKLSDTLHHVNVQEAIDAALKSDAPSEEEKGTDNTDHTRTDKGLQDTRGSSTDTGSGDGRGDVTTRETTITSDVKTVEDLLSKTDTDTRTAHNALIDQQHPRGENTSSGGQVAAGSQAAEDQIGDALTQSIGHFTTGTEFGADGPQGQHGDKAPSDAADQNDVDKTFTSALGKALQEHGATFVGTDDNGVLHFKGSDGTNITQTATDFHVTTADDNDILSSGHRNADGSVTVKDHTSSDHTVVTTTTSVTPAGDLVVKTQTQDNQTDDGGKHTFVTTQDTTTTTHTDGSSETHKGAPQTSFFSSNPTGIPSQVNEDQTDPHRAQEIVHQLDPTGRLAAELAGQHAGPGSGSGHGSGNSDPSQDPSSSDEARTVAPATPLVKDLLGGDRGGNEPDFGSGVGAGGPLPAGGVTNTATAGRGDPTDSSLSPIRTSGPDERAHQTVKTDPTAHHDTGGTNASTEAPPPVEHVTPLHDRLATPATAHVPDTVHPHDPNATNVAPDPGTADRLASPTTAHVPDGVHPHDPNASSDDTDFGSGPSPSSHTGDTSGDPPSHAGTGLDTAAPVHITEPDISHIGVPPADSAPPPAEPPPHEQIITEHEPFHVPDHLQLHDPHDDNPDDD